MTDAGDATLPNLDELLCFAVYSTGFAFNRMYRRPLMRLGLTYPQFLVMAALWDRNSVAVGVLGTKLSLDTNTLTPLLKRLEAMGLIVRERSKQDERRVIVSLTEKGSRMRSEAGSILRCTFVANLTRDIQALRRNLERAAEA
jgi:DNA-binding MarR family transcriptional regulator